MPEGEEIEWKLDLEVQVNGRGNTDRAKVAIFFVH